MNQFAIPKNKSGLMSRPFSARIVRMSMERFRAVDLGSVVGAAILAAGGWRGTIHFARAEMNLSSFEDLSGTIERTPRSPSMFTNGGII